MNPCKKMRERIDSIGGDRVLLEEIRRDEPHLAGCPGCSEYLLLAESLAALRGAVVVPDADLAAARSRVMALAPWGLRRGPAEGAPSPGLVHGFRRRRPMFVRVLTTGAAALIGYAAANIRPILWPTAEPSRAILNRLERTASTADRATASPSERYVLADVRMLSADADHVEIRCIVGQEMRLRLDRSDPLLVNAIVRPWLEDGLLYQRMKAIELADPEAGAALRDALIAVMRNDPNPGARLAAATRLAGMRQDRVVLDAFLGVLRSGATVPVKVAAFDTLVKWKCEPAAIRAALDAGDPATSRPVFLLAERYLNSYSD